MGAVIEGIKCNVGNQELEPIHIAAKNGHGHIVNYILSQAAN
jgi:hypothetical protein